MKLSIRGNAERGVCFEVHCFWNIGAFAYEEKKSKEALAV